VDMGARLGTAPSVWSGISGFAGDEIEMGRKELHRRFWPPPALCSQWWMIRKGVLRQKRDEVEVQCGRSGNWSQVPSPEERRIPECHPTRGKSCFCHIPRTSSLHLNPQTRILVSRSILGWSSTVDFQWVGRTLYREGGFRTNQHKSTVPLQQPHREVG